MSGGVIYQGPRPILSLFNLLVYSQRFLHNGGQEYPKTQAPGERVMRTAIVFLFIVATSNLYAQVIFSESFEVPDTANFTTFGIGSSFVTADATWDVLGGSVDIYEAAARPEAVAYDLAQAIDLAGSPGAAIIETSIATTPGQTYQLEFFYARNNNLGTTLGEARVETEGNSILLDRTIQHDPQVYSFFQHMYFEDFFVANSTATKLRFTSLVAGVAGITLDAITVTEVDLQGLDVPLPPAAVFVVGIMFIWIACYRRKI